MQRGRRSRAGKRQRDNGRPREYLAHHHTVSNTRQAKRTRPAQLSTAQLTHASLHGRKPNSTYITQQHRHAARQPQTLNENGNAYSYMHLQSGTQAGGLQRTSVLQCSRYDHTAPSCYAPSTRAKRQHKATAPPLFSVRFCFQILFKRNWKSNINDENVANIFSPSTNVSSVDRAP